MKNEKKGTEIEVMPKKAGLMQRFEQQGSVILRRAEALEVRDETGRAKAAEIREQARQVVKEIEAEFADDREKAHSLWKAIVARIKRMTDVPARVMAIVDAKMDAYLREEDRKRREAEEAARKEAEAQAERERQALLKKAARAEAKGNEEAAEAARYEAEQVQADAPIVAGPEKSIQTASGSTGAIRDFEIVVENKAVFFQEVVVARGMFGLVEIKPGPLKDFAKMQRVGDKLPSIPGCKVSEKFRFAGRGRNGA